MTVKVVRYTPEQLRQELADLYVFAEKARADMARYATAEARLATIERRIRMLEYLAGHDEEDTARGGEIDPGTIQGDEMTGPIFFD